MVQDWMASRCCAMHWAPLCPFAPVQHAGAAYLAPLTPVLQVLGAAAGQGAVGRACAPDDGAASHGAGAGCGGPPAWNQGWLMPRLLAVCSGPLPAHLQGGLTPASRLALGCWARR